MPVVQQDVLRLDIPVDDTVAVRIVECVRDGDRDPHRLVHRQLTIVLEPLA
ncbi:hypothetical protein D3C83_115020 [compost metagenome]